MCCDRYLDIFLETIWIEDMLNENNKIHESSLSHITHAGRMCAVQADTKHRNRSLFRINFNPCAQMRAQEALC